MFCVMAHSHCFFGSFNMDKHKCYVTFPVKYISALIRKKYSAYLEIVTGSCNFLLGVDTDFSSNPISQEQEHVYFLILTRFFIPHYPHVKSPTNVGSAFIVVSTQDNVVGYDHGRKRRPPTLSPRHLS